MCHDQDSLCVCGKVMVSLFRVPILFQGFHRHICGILWNVSTALRDSLFIVRIVLHEIPTYVNSSSLILALAHMSLDVTRCHSCLQLPLYFISHIPAATLRLHQSASPSVASVNLGTRWEDPPSQASPTSPGDWRVRRPKCIKKGAMLTKTFEKCWKYYLKKIQYVFSEEMTYSTVIPTCGVGARVLTRPNATICHAMKWRSSHPQPRICKRSWLFFLHRQGGHLWVVQVWSRLRSQSMLPFLAWSGIEMPSVPVFFCFIHENKERMLCIIHHII